MPMRPKQAYLNGKVLERKEVSGFVLEEVLDSARSKVAQHSHEAAYFCIALSGNCIERFGTKTRDCKALSWGFFPAGEAHSFEIDSTESRSFGISIGPRWLERAHACSIVLDHSERSQGGIVARMLMRVYYELHHVDEASPLAIEAGSLSCSLLCRVAELNLRVATRPAGLARQKNSCALIFLSI